MKKIFTFLFLFYINLVNGQKQDITLDNLVACSMMPPATFTNFIQRKGYKVNNDSLLNNGNSFLHTQKDKSLKQLIERSENDDTVILTYKTTSPLEFANLQQEIVRSNFSTYKTQGSAGNTSYQKKSLRAKLSQQQRGGITFYTIVLENKKLPSATEINYAEDLLQLNSHEYIVAVFGAANVKNDQFYFSEKEVNKCSILFPNTSNQVLFIWNDEVNCQNIAFIILGGQANSSSNTAIFNGNQFYKWRSKQGIYLGMPLKELQTLNGKSIDFYSWDSDQPGFVLNKENGNINLQNLGIQLQCLECYSNDKIGLRPVLSSESVLSASDRVYVNSIILLPEKRMPQKSPK